MNARGCDLSALGALYGPSSTELAEAIRSGISRAADLSRSLADSYACDALAAQLVGLGRELHRLRGMLTEGCRHEST
ncbi:MAG: hypothetical protein AB7V26_11545 [Lysobacterales bacterium]